MSGESDALHERVRRFIAGRGSDSFDALACAIARFQRRFIAPLRNLAAADPERAADIPAMPCDAFRLRRIAAHPESDDERVFLTSGTTQGARGRHPMRTTAAYRAAALAWADRMLWPDSRAHQLVCLAADEARAPDSSLSFMLARFAEILGGASWHWDGERLDVGGARRSIEAARAPVLVAGTSFAFVHLCDALGATTLPLPPGSRAMQTGGYKGRSREVAASALRREIARVFALPETHVVAEYGMTELSSQLYQATLAHALGHFPAPASATAYYPPPWLSATAVDPLTLAPFGPGREGICRLVDLANVDSSVAIQTADRIVEHPDGSIELLGRMPGATPRGCSLALGEVLRS